MSPRDPESIRHAEVLKEETEIAHDFLRVTTPAERRRAFAILFISLVCMGAGQTVLFNILPPLSRQLNLSTVQTTTIFAVSAAVWVVTSTYWGRKSDHWGRKPVMLLGLLAFAASFALLRRLHCLHERLGAGAGDRAQRLNHLDPAHANTVVLDGQ